MGKFICRTCGKQTDARDARVCSGCHTTVCGACADKEQDLCGGCYDYLGYLN